MSLVAFPDVLSQMNEHLDWTQKLGDAMIGQEADVADFDPAPARQGLRRRQPAEHAAADRHDAGLGRQRAVRHPADRIRRSSTCRPTIRTGPTAAGPIPPIRRPIIRSRARWRAASSGARVSPPRARCSAAGTGAGTAIPTPTSTSIARRTSTGTSTAPRLATAAVGSTVPSIARVWATVTPALAKGTTRGRVRAPRSVISSAAASKGGNARPGGGPAGGGAQRPGGGAAQRPGGGPGAAQRPAGGGAQGRPGGGQGVRTDNQRPAH